MKFENPIMNISMFEVENVVTQASDPAPGPQTSDAAAAEAIAAELGADNTLTITF